MNKEPTVIIGAVAEIIRAIIPVMLIFGYLNWTDPQIGQVMLLIGVIVAVGEKLFVRSQVVPTQVANAQIQTGIDSPTGTTVPQVIAKTAEDAAARNATQ